MATWITPTFALLLCCMLRLTHQQTVNSPVVETTLGKIQGTVMKSQSGTDFYAYRGIRYAKAPTGALRFAPPEPVAAWTNTLMASQDSLICPQPPYMAKPEFMSEDCLALNVYTRNVAGNAPVMVYIHGGANIIGSGHSQYEAGPQYLMDYDVVFVSFNYRLGALGFSSTATKEAPGNNGYLDQVLALKWVKDHIVKFGGNPELVTIFGMSAGAMAVTLHMASPLSKGLFHRAIAMSGSATNHFDIDNVYWTRKLARELSCPMYNTKDVLDCMRTKSWSDIITVCAQWEPFMFINMKWNYELDDNFMPMSPSQAIYKENFNKVPLLAGFTKNEMDFTVDLHENNAGLLNDISLNFDLYAPELFLYNAEDDQGNPSKSTRIRNFYLGENNNVTKSNLQQFGEMFSDSIIGHGVHRLVQQASYHTPTYYYRLDYVGQRSFYLKDNKPKGAGHGDDLQYVMPSTWYGSQLAADAPDMFMVNRYTKWFTSFAKDGKPSNEFENQWAASENGKIVAVINAKETSIEEEPFKERYQLWDEMFPGAESGATQLKLTALFVVLLGLLNNFI